MTRKTLRQSIFEIVESYPDLAGAHVLDTVLKLGYKDVKKTDVEAIISEAKFAQSTAVYRHRDLAPDNNVWELSGIEKKGQIKFGIIGDTHFGSKHHKREELEKTVNIMLNEGVKHFFCPGDLLEGFDVYRGQAQDVLYNTEDEQIAEAVSGLPMLPKGSQYYWISGNHDLIWLKRATGSDPLVLFQESRPDVTYLGKYSTYIYLNKNVSVQMVHPDRRMGNSASGPGEKYVERLPNNRRADITIFGHWHNPCSAVHKGSYIELNASFQGTNELSIRNGWPNVVGGKIIDITLDAQGRIGRYKKEDILFWEKSLGLLTRKKL